MRRYSHLFSTLHDDEKSVGNLGRGTHYSILRAVIWRASVPHFHDFAVIWDEDHDTRVISVIEHLYVRGLLSLVLAIGERKGNVTALTSLTSPQAPSLVTELEKIAQENTGDPWCSAVGTMADTEGIINDSAERVSAYLKGVHALWELGTTAIVLGSPEPLAPTLPFKQ